MTRSGGDANKERRAQVVKREAVDENDVSRHGAALAPTPFHKQRGAEVFLRPFPFLGCHAGQVSNET
jgi:hypothetical protein